MPLWKYDPDALEDDKLVSAAPLGDSKPLTRELTTTGKVTNKKWVIKEWPEDAFDPEKHVELIEESIDLDAPVPEGKLIIQVEMLGVDAFVRTMMAPGAFHGEAGKNSILPSLGYGVVVKTSEGGLAVGKRVVGLLGVQEYAVTDQGSVTLVETYGQPPSSCLSMFGRTTGLTAYAGVHCTVNPPKEGQTVIVSAAGGGVGVYAAQLCKATGAKVIGVAGGKDKCAFLTNELGLDGAVDYKDKDATLGEQLDKLCPEGIDFFFDGVGGEILNEVLNRLKMNAGARVVLCGGVTKYNKAGGVKGEGGPKDYLKVAERSAIMAGFVVDLPDKYPIGIKYLISLKEKGALKVFETRTTGIETYPKSLNGLFTGASKGKTLVELVPGHDV